MKFVCISDTHLRHPDLSEFPGDVILHAGDVSMGGSLREILLFLEWYSSLPYVYKILIPGNHDFLFEENFGLCKNLCDEKNIICLNDSITFLPRKICKNQDLKKFDKDTPVDGGRIKIWGSPVTPWYHGWAFNKSRGCEIQRHWDLIPENLDILMTHGPAADTGKLSIVIDGEDVGCEDLKRIILEKKPKFHIFGHIHEGYGKLETTDTTYINCSILNRNYNIANKPVVFEMD